MDRGHGREPHALIAAVGMVRIHDGHLQLPIAQQAVESIGASWK